MTIQEIQDEIIGEFEYLGDWEEKYEYIISLGRELAPYPSEYRNEGNRVKGCQSQVWLCSEVESGRMHLAADSDAMIPKGLVSLILRIFQDQPVDEIVSADLYFLDRVGLSTHLSPSRSNGVALMIRKIKELAILKGSEIGRRQDE
jgi:cysteine desulfuration protein SufE